MTIPDYSEEQAFFHSIAHTILTFVKENRKKAVVEKYKTEGSELNYVTQIDIECENLIVAEITTRFPTDKIIAEENFSDQKATDHGRYWAVDPICGTGNLARGLTIFCTNIALIENGKIVASCVMDHSTGEYIWSIGNDIVFRGDKKHEPKEVKTGVTIEVDLGCLYACDKDEKKHHAETISKIIQETDYATISLNTSLAFTYVAIGKLSGFVSPNNRIWDIAAGNFLIGQSGGILTNYNGKPWTIYDQNCIAARIPDIHGKLLSLIK